MPAASIPALRYTLAACICAAGLISVAFAYTPAENNADLRAHADAVIETCADSSYRPTCYDKEIPKLMDDLTMEEAFAVTRMVQEEDSDYWYCHVLGHNISAREAAKDPSQWTDVVARCPQGMCSNGCLHGAFQERFRGGALSDEEIEGLIPDLKTICESGRDFTDLEQASCYHALGHLTMYINEGDPRHSSDLCDRVAQTKSGDFRQLCYDGVFMQIFQPLEPEDIALVQDIAPETQEESVALCNEYSGKRYASCHSESWPMYEDQIETPEGLEAFCNRAEGENQRTRCLNGLFYVVTPRLDFDAEKTSSFCNELSGTTRVQCYANASSRMIETDYRLSERATSLCSAANDSRTRNRCFEELLLYSTYNFHPESDAFFSLCEAMPEPWRTRCINQERPQSSPRSYE